MKNFTNNFKQFTSRLSARWLFMALMLLVGTSSAWAVDYYLRGTFNGWLDGGMQDAYKFAGGSGTVSVDLNANTTYNFKIATSNWSEEYSNEGTMTRDNCTNWTTSKTGDCKITTDVQGQYKFTFSADKEISVQYPPLCSSCCTNYYVAGDAGLCGEDWNVNADKMTCSNNVWTKTFTNINNGTYYFQITNGTWDVKKGDYDNSKGNITLSNVDDGYGAKKIKLTTTSKGNITISFDGTKAWVDFEQPCYSSSDVEPGTISSNATNNTICGSGTVELTLSNTTTKDGLTKSIQWQKQSGNTWSDINNAKSTTYTTENLSATTIYRAKVTWTKTGCDNIVEYANVTVTVNALPSAPGLKTASSIKVCPGNLTLANYVNVASGTTVLWFTDEDCTQSANSPSIAAGERKVFYAKAKNTSTGCLSAGKTTLTITAYSAPADFTLTAIPTEICSGADVVISISNKQDGVTYKLGDTEINESITVKPKNETSSPIEKKYTVTASLIACPTLINEKSASITVNPLPEITIDLQSFAICMGDGENVETGLTFLAIAKASEGSIPVWYDAEEGGNVVTNASLDKNATYYVAARNETTGCESDRLPFVVTVNKRPENPTLRESEYKVCEDASNTVNLSELAGVNDVRWYLGKTEVEKPDQVSLATAGIFVYTAKAVNDAGCVSADGVEFTLTVYAQPTFTAPAATQTNIEITLESAAGASTQWSVSPTENVTLTDNDDGTATFVATANGDYTITAQTPFDAVMV